jgi:aspartyl-tRNA(Asn)/glutamyl-tRNA(Gln) amidotransferase subunit C
LIPCPSIDDVKRIAKLARIRVNEDEAAGYQGQLNGIFGLIEEMQAVNTAGVEPMSHAQDLAQRLRADVVTEPNRHEAVPGHRPQTENGLYLVPKVIE